MKWISVKDKMPEEDQHVLITDGEDVVEGWLDTCSDKDVWYYSDYYQKQDITHWMPLPKPPNTNIGSQ